MEALRHVSVTASGAVGLIIAVAALDAVSLLAFRFGLRTAALHALFMSASVGSLLWLCGGGTRLRGKRGPHSPPTPEGESGWIQRDWLPPPVPGESNLHTDDGRK